MAERSSWYSFILKTIMPSEGWQAVFVDNTQLRQHVVHQVHALALAYRILRWKDQIIEPPEPKEDDWKIVGLIYMPKHGWLVCDKEDNFCGLLPPGMTLDEFQSEARCRYQHPRQWLDEEISDSFR